MKTQETTPELKRYIGRVLCAGKLFIGEYVDWFANDEAAQIGYREIMAEQGYKVLSVTIGNPCIVEVA